MKNRHKLKVINETTNKCFDAHARHEVSCQKIDCKNHISDVSHQNCVIIAAQKGPHTLQNIGKIYGLTRMRICQIEKNIIEKLKNYVVL